MATSLVPVPTLSCHTSLLSQRQAHHIRFHTSSNFLLPQCLSPAASVATATRSLTHIALCSSTSSVVEQQNQQQDQEDEQEFSSTSQQPSSDDLPPGACTACGKSEIERGCNGEGRIQGGIATVPGFGWWPIKAYRPCPAFVASGGRYTRQGQSMDEVASGGRYARGSSVSMSSDEVKSGKNTKDPKKFKR